MKKSWVLIEKQDDQFIVLAGTEDPKAVDVMIDALLDYKKTLASTNMLDLSIVRRYKEEERSPLNRTLENSEDDMVERIFSQVVE